MLKIRPLILQLYFYQVIFNNHFHSSCFHFSQTLNDKKSFGKFWRNFPWSFPWKFRKMMIEIVLIPTTIMLNFASEHFSLLFCKLYVYPFLLSVNNPIKFHLFSFAVHLCFLNWIQMAKSTFSSLIMFSPYFNFG